MHTLFRGAAPSTIRIKYDECLSSWLIRLANTTEEKIQVQAYLTSVGDPDFGFETIASREEVSEFSAVEVYLERHCDLVNKYFKAKTLWILPWDERSVFCFQCFEEDIAAGGSPYWRKSWCYLHVPVCIKHGRFLLHSGPAWLQPEKAWSVYLERLRERSSRGEQRVDRSLGKGSYRRAELLALRVQMILISAHNNPHLRLPGHDGMVSGREVLMVTRILLESFLFPRLSRIAGAARGMQSGLPRIRGKLPLERARALGCSDSHVYSRVTALILVGCVFQIIPQVRFRSARDALYLSACLASGLPADIARSGMILEPGRDYTSMLRRLEGVSEELRCCLAEFLDGLKPWH